MIVSGDHMSLLFQNNFHLNNEYVCLCVSMCTCAGGHQSLQWVLDPLKLEMLMVIILHVGA